jgi:hypothetical protein
MKSKFNCKLPNSPEKQERFITEEASNVKDLDAFTCKFFIKGEERIGMRKVIEKYQG